MLAAGVRRLEELGVVVRVRAPTTLAHDSAEPQLHRCVQLLRMPTEEDWRLLFQLTKPEHDKLIESVPIQDVHDKLHGTSSTTMTEAVTGNESVNKTESAFVPLWSPDRLLTHTMYSTLLEAGTTGLSTKNLKRMMTGLFYSRPIDRFLDRCVKSWQKSQPLRLRHLAIIRDTAQLGRTSFYIHFAHDAFGVKVDNGETFWEAIHSYSEPDQTISVDEYGFEILSSSMFAGNKNDLPLKKALEAAENDDQNSHTLSINGKQARTSKKSQLRNVLKAPGVSLRASQQGHGKAAPVKARGRPRKYPTNNSTLDFSKMSHAQINNAIVSQKRAQEYLRKKARKEVEIRTSKGMSKDEAEKGVITELGLTPQSYLRNTIEEPEGFKKLGRGRAPKRKRQKILPTYLPSILAHTFPLYGHGGPLSDTLEEPAMKRRKLSKIEIGYLPSVLAHTSLVYPSYTFLETKQNLVIANSYRRRSRTYNKKRRGSTSETYSSDLLSSVPSLDPSYRDPEHIALDAHTIESTRLRATEDTLDSQAILKFPELPRQPIGSRENRLEGMTPSDNAEGHPCEPHNLSLKSDGIMTPVLKRKASASELAEFSPKKQCNNSLALPSVQVFQENINNAEGNILDKTLIAAAASSPHGFGTVGNHHLTKIDIANSEPHAPPDVQQDFTTNQQPTLSERKDDFLATDTQKASPVKRKRQRMAPFGGTIAAMRKLIILDIVKNSDGVFPGDGELVLPFIAAYVKKFPDAKPDSKTIKVAKTTLIGDGQLKQIFFTYKASTGTVHTKSIITLPDVTDTDERVKELQDAMIKAHPCLFYPSGTDVRADLAPKSVPLDAGSSRGGRKATTVKDLPVISAVVVPQREVRSRNQASRKRANEFVTQDETTPKKLRQSEISSPAQTQPEENMFLVSKRAQALEVAAEPLNKISVPIGPFNLQAQLIHETLIDQVPAVQTCAIDSRGHQSLGALQDANIMPGMGSQYDSFPKVQMQGPYQGRAPPEAPSPAEGLVADDRRNRTDPLVTESRDIFVHYPFPVENFYSVPIRKNPVGRKRINKVQPEKPPKKTKARTKDRVLDSVPLAQHLLAGLAVKNGGGKSQKSKTGKLKAVAPKPSTLELHEQKQEKTPGIRYSKSSRTKSRQIEFRRERRIWEPENDQKLLIATLICHVTYGGVREENHWAIISKMLGHLYDTDLCRRRWATIKAKYREGMEVIYLELRSALLDSYEKGKMPKLSYENIWENDWEGILAWAMDKIENPASEDVDLPTSRETFESAFSVQEFPSREGPDFFENKRVASIPVRLSVLNNGARVLTGESKKPVTELEVAKSYILANVLTPKKAYDAEKAREKLLGLSEATVEYALNGLLADKVVAQTNRGRAAPERTYDISHFYLKAMQWKLSVAHFKYATAFKEILDKKLEMDGKMQYKQAFGNGEMITLINLLADGMLDVEGKGIPNKKFGLATEGYKTRGIDKKVYDFEIHIRPRKDYIKGQPCAPLPLPPTQRHNQSMENAKLPLNPLWIDINGDLLPVMWDLAVAAVATILVVNTGSDAENVAKKLHPCVASFEVQLIMQWLVDAGAAEWRDEIHDCLNLKTWWWSVIITPIAKNANTKEATMIAGQQMQH